LFGDRPPKKTAPARGGKKSAWVLDPFGAFNGVLVAQKVEFECLGSKKGGAAYHPEEDEKGLTNSKKEESAPHKKKKKKKKKFSKSRGKKECRPGGGESGFFTNKEGSVKGTGERAQHQGFF